MAEACVTGSDSTAVVAESVLCDPAAKFSSELLKSCADLHANGDGKIKREEMVKPLKMLGWTTVSDEDLEKLIHSLGVEDDGNGFVNVSDFVDAFSNSASVAAIAKLEAVDTSAEEMIACFKFFDKNGDGKISLDELRQALVMIGVKAKEEEVLELMKLGDINNDGRICYDEFVKLLSAPM